jgi:hypothetical protein
MSYCVNREGQGHRLEEGEEGGREKVAGSSGREHYGRSIDNSTRIRQWHVPTVERGKRLTIDAELVVAKRERRNTDRVSNKNIKMTQKQYRLHYACDENSLSHIQHVYYLSLFADCFSISLLTSALRRFQTHDYNFNNHSTRFYCTSTMAEQLFSKHREMLDGSFLLNTEYPPVVKGGVKGNGGGKSNNDDNAWLYHKLKIMNSNMYDNRSGISDNQESRVGVFQPKDGTLQYLTIAPESGVSSNFHMITRFRFE